MKIKKDNNWDIVDPNIQRDYDLIMKDSPKEISRASWEKVGEYYKQFSVYEGYYSTRESNCVSSY